MTSSALLMSGAAVLCCATYAGSLLVARYFVASGQDWRHIVMHTAAVSLTIAATLCVAPSIDLFLTVNTHVAQQTTRAFYFVIFALTTFWFFVVSPFVFFLAKTDASEPICANFCKAIRRSIATIIFFLACLILGLAFRPGHEEWSEQALTQRWMDRLFDTAHTGASALSFVIGVCASAGLYFMIIFTGYGLAALPADMIRGYKDPEAERLQLRIELEKVSSELRKLDKRKSSSTRAAGRRLKLSDRVVTLQMQIRYLTAVSNGSAGRLGCAGLMKFVGCIGLPCSLAIVSALVLSATDPGMQNPRCESGEPATLDTAQPLNTSAATVSGPVVLGDPVRLLCQVERGYVGALLNKPRLYNPLDASLVALADHFPLDLVLLTVTTAYLIVCSVYGMTRLGLRLFFGCCCSVARFRPHRSGPGAVLILGLAAMLMGVAILVQVPAMAPKYATFGAQSFTNTHGILQHCSLAEDVHLKERNSRDRECSMSQVAIQLVDMTRGYPIFNHVFFAASICLALSTCVSLLWKLACSSKASRVPKFDVSSATGGMPHAVSGASDWRQDDIEMSKGLLDDSSHDDTYRGDDGDDFFRY